MKRVREVFSTVLPVLFKWVLFSSIMGSALTLLILFAKSILGMKLNARWHYYIWFLLLVRLTIPYAPQSPISISSLFVQVHNIEKIALFHNNNINIADVNELKNSFPEIPAETPNIEKVRTVDLRQKTDKLTGNIIYAAKPKNKIFIYDIVSIIWLLGMLLIFIYSIASNIKLALKIRNKSLCEDATIIRILHECKEKMKVKSDIIVISDNSIRTPMLFAFFKYKLLISPALIENMTHDEKRYIILHELAHFKRKDYLVNWIIVILQILHWFNPFIWYAFHKMKQDCEIACDATALSYITPEEHRNYADTIVHTIILFSQPHLIPGASTIGNITGIKRRILMIMNSGKHSKKWTLIAIVVILILGCIGLPSAVTPSKANENFKNNNTDLSHNEKIQSITISTAALHNSDKQLPSSQVAEQAQKKVFDELSKLGVEKVRKAVHEMHMRFESYFVSENLAEKLADPKNPGWEFWERTGVIEIPGYTEAVLNETNGNVFIQRLEDIKGAITDSVFKDDIATTQTLIQYAVDNHDIAGLHYAHQILHDLDYWIISYPIQYQKGRPAPPDLKGINVYFGTIKLLNSDYPDNIKILLKKAKSINISASSILSDSIIDSEKTIEYALSKIKSEHLNEVRQTVHDLHKIMNNITGYGHIQKFDTTASSEWKIFKKDNGDYSKLQTGIKKLSPIVGDSSIKTDIQAFQSYLEIAVNERSYGELISAHRIIHDLDNWVLWSGSIDSESSEYFESTVTIEGENNSYYRYLRYLLYDESF